MALLLEAKQFHRKAATTASDADTNQTTGSMREAGLNLMEKPLAVNYALFLHAKGNVQDAIQATRSIVEAPANADLLPSSDSKHQTDEFLANQDPTAVAKATDAAVRGTAYMRKSIQLFLHQCRAWFSLTNSVLNS